jgi:hypothetical protein
MLKPSRRRLFQLLVTLLVALVVGGMWLAAYAVHFSRVDLDVSRYEDFIREISDENLRYFAQAMYDADLGWDFRPGDQKTRVNRSGADWSYVIDELGARRSAPQEGALRVATYGDSFTFCDEVNDDETWQHFLSIATGSSVQNFGVMGYGTDQALLKLERHLEQGREFDVVILGLMSGDINRVMNGFRPFITGQRETAYHFKPMFVPSGGGYRLLNFVPQEVKRSAFLESMKRASRHDFWLRRSPAETIEIKAAGGMVWQYEEATSKMHFLVQRFADLAQRNRFKGVLLFIPMPGEVRRKSIGQGSHYQAFVDEVEAAASLTQIDVVDVFDAEFDPVRFNVEPFDGHASVYGNRVIAGLLQRVISPFRDKSGVTPVEGASGG